jgi:hypothetical protein
MPRSRSKLEWKPAFNDVLRKSKAYWDHPFVPRGKGVSKERKEGERLKRQYITALKKLAMAGDDRLERVTQYLPGFKVTRRLKDKTIIFACDDAEWTLQGFCRDNRFLWNPYRDEYPKIALKRPSFVLHMVPKKKKKKGFCFFPNQKVANRDSYRLGYKTPMAGTTMIIPEDIVWYAGEGRESTTLALFYSQDFYRLPKEIKKGIMLYLF